MSPPHTTSLACCLLMLFAVAQANYQFALTNYASTAGVNFQYLLNLPSSENKFLLSTDYFPSTRSFQVASTSSLAPISNVTYNRQPFGAIQAVAQYPKVDPNYVYVIASSSNYENYDVLKIETTNLQVVASTTVTDLGGNGGYFMDLSPDGETLYAVGTYSGDHNSFSLNLYMISTISMTVTQNVNLATTVGQTINGFVASSQKLFLLGSDKLYILDSASATVLERYPMPGGLFFYGAPVYLDETNNYLYTSTSQDSGELIYTETFQLTKFNLNDATFSIISTFDTYGVGFVDYLLVDMVKGVAYFGCESQGLYYGTQVYPQSPPLLVAVDIGSWKVVGYTVQPGQPLGYTAGRQYSAIFSDDSKKTIILASGTLLASISIDSLSSCTQPTFAQTLSSQNGQSGTYTVTISNPSTQTITDLRLSACNESIASPSTFTINHAYDNTCGVPQGLYLTLPSGTVIPPSGSITFSYVNSNSTSPLAFRTEYVACSSSSTSAPPTSGPSSGCPSITITQTVSNEWTQDGVRNAVYNAVFTNTGSTTISTLMVTGDSGVVSAWGLTENNDHTYGLPSYGVIAPGAQFSWGYIRSGNGPSTFTLSGCGASPTTAPSSPTSPPASGPSNFPVSITQEVASTWTGADSQTCQQVNVHVKNTSPSATLTSIQIAPSADFANVQQFWSVTQSGSYLTFPSFVTSLTPNAQFDWGYVNCGALITFTVNNAF